MLIQAWVAVINLCSRPFLTSPLDFSPLNWSWGRWIAESLIFCDFWRILIYIFIYVYIHVHLHVCIYIYTYIYIYASVSLNSRFGNVKNTSAIDSFSRAWWISICGKHKHEQRKKRKIELIASSLNLQRGWERRNSGLVKSSLERENEDESNHPVYKNSHSRIFA